MRTAAYHVTALTRLGSAKITAVVRAVPTSSGLSGYEDDGKATQYANEARELLDKAVELCNEPFQNAKQLKTAAKKSIKLVGRRTRHLRRARLHQAGDGRRVEGNGNALGSLL